MPNQDAIGVGRNQDGRLQIFVIGIDHQVWSKYQMTANGGWSDWVPFGGSLPNEDAIGVGRNKDGRLQIFVIGADHQVWTKYQTQINGSWSGWVSLGGSLLYYQQRSIGVGSNQDGRLEIFVIGNDHILYTKYQTQINGGGWSGWTPLWGHWQYGDQIGVGSNQDGRLEVFLIGDDEALYTSYQTQINGGWSGWVSLGGSLLYYQQRSIGVGSNQDGRLEIFVIGNDHILYTKYQTQINGGGWSGWTPLWGHWQYGDQIGVGSNQDGRLEVFLIGDDKALYTSYQTQINGGWSGWVPFGGSLSNQDAIGVGFNQDGRLQIFVIATDQKMWTRYQTTTNGGWSDWVQLIGNGGGGGSLPTVVLLPTNLHVDDVLGSQPIGAFVDPQNRTGSSGSYAATVDFGAGNAPSPALVTPASSAQPCPPTLNNSSNAGCFLISHGTTASDTPYLLAGRYQMTIYVASLTGTASGAATAAVTVAKSNYTVQTTAWIPFPMVVDPENIQGFRPAEAALVLGFPDCGMPRPLFLEPQSSAESVLRGDGHPGYAGSFRVRTTAEFQWDGSTISNFNPTVTPSTSIRDITYRYLLPNLTSYTWQCPMAKTATVSTTSRLIASYSFFLDYSSATPLVPPAPTIDASLQGTFRSDGTIDFHYLTDGFPSHGVEIIRNGQIQQVDILNDPLCLGQNGVLGPLGARQVLRGLNGIVTTTGDFTDEPTRLGVGGFDHQSLLC